MYIIVQHRITAPAGFQALGEEPSPDRPAHWRLVHALPSRDGLLCICLWEAESVEVLREFIERAYARVSVNDYYEVDEQNAMGLMQLFTLVQIVAPQARGGT